jgi:galactonate dehydratase
VNRRQFFQGLFGYTALLGAARGQGTARAPKLKIREVRAVRLRNFNSKFVRVYTEEGLTGTGETLDNVGSELIINNNVGPALAGRDPLDIEGILADLFGWKRLAGGGPSPVFMEGLGGPYLSAVSGVEMALWDLAGKALGLPVYQLLGGRIRNKIPAYFHAATPQQAKDMVAKTGVRGLKIGIDYNPEVSTLRKGYDPNKDFNLTLNNPQIDDIVRMVSDMRDAVGMDFGLMVECHARYDTESGIQIAKALEPFRPMWIEEPVPSDNIEAMVRIRESSHVPIAAGENIYTRYGYRPYLERQALSIIQPDFAKTGGLMEGRKIAAMAEIYSIPIAPHGVATALGTTAAAHVCSVVPNLLILEWTHRGEPSYDSLTTLPAWDAGYLVVPDRPGIGIEINPDAVKERLDEGFRML